MSIKDSFLVFLENNNCTEQFKINFHNDKDHDSLDDLIKEGEYFLIIQAFLWDGTPEGEEYWSDIDQLWYEYYESM